MNPTIIKWYKRSYRCHQLNSLAQVVNSENTGKSRTSHLPAPAVDRYPHEPQWDEIISEVAYIPISYELKLFLQVSYSLLHIVMAKW